MSVFMQILITFAVGVLFVIGFLIVAERRRHQEHELDQKLEQKRARRRTSSER